MVFWLLLADSLDFCMFGVLWFLLDQASATDSCWLFADWTGLLISDNKDWNCSPKLLLNRFAPPRPVSHLILLPLVGGLTGKLKCLRILIKVSFEKNLSQHAGLDLRTGLAYN